MEQSKESMKKEGTHRQVKHQEDEDAVYTLARLDYIRKDVLRDTFSREYTPSRYDHAHTMFLDKYLEDMSVTKGLGSGIYYLLVKVTLNVLLR